MGLSIQTSTFLQTCAPKSANKKKSSPKWGVDSVILGREVDERAEIEGFVPINGVHLPIGGAVGHYSIACGKGVGFGELAVPHFRQGCEIGEPMEAAESLILGGKSCGRIFEKSWGAGGLCISLIKEATHFEGALPGSGGASSVEIALPCLTCLHQWYHP